MRLAGGTISKCCVGIACSLFVAGLICVGAALANDINYVSSILWSNVKDVQVVDSNGQKVLAQIRRADLGPSIAHNF